MAIAAWTVTRIKTINRSERARPLGLVIAWSRLELASAILADCLYFNLKRISGMEKNKLTIWEQILKPLKNSIVPPQKYYSRHTLRNAQLDMLGRPRRIWDSSKKGTYIKAKHGQLT